MGFNFIGTNSCSTYDIPQSNPNPKPDNFNINSTQTIGRFLIVDITYNGCTNFEGRKILVYENVHYTTLKMLTNIDPHFSDNPNYISPVARFRPTNRGIAMALEFCKSMTFRDYNIQKLPD